MRGGKPTLIFQNEFCHSLGLGQPVTKLILKNDYSPDHHFPAHTIPIAGHMAGRMAGSPADRSNGGGDSLGANCDE